ncbi:MAG: ATP-binding protein [Candidatus Ozemobacteraceae bacterium]
MDIDEFDRIIAKGENQFVDFKIECNAFDSKSSNQDEAKAELVKDILAMANNKGTLSLILIGVSDDGKDFKSVINKKLTDDNLQSLCKEVISPPPKVNLFSFDVPPIPGKTDLLRCVIILVGPHVEKVFKFNRDFISPKKAERQYHFRRNEVWIRRGATSDLNCFHMAQ